MRGAAWLIRASALALATLVYATQRGNAEPEAKGPGAATSAAAPSATSAAAPPATSAAAPSATSAAAPSAAAPPAALEARSEAAPPAAPPLPTRIPVTPPDYEVLDAGSDRPIRVLKAAQPGRRVLVYLHGHCGDVNAVGAFAPVAAAYGTLLALLGDQPCKDKPGRFKWGNDSHALDQRITRAIRLVNRAHSWELDPYDITLFGYSQGAVRAEALARYYPRRYPRVILGGPPRRPKVEHFKNVQAIAVFGGELEDTRNMQGGAEDLIAAGFRAHFFLLPGVDHGDFGGELAGNLALSEILDFVSAPAAAPAAAPLSEPAPAKIAR